ncbi:MAG: ADP-ribosylglycohydrolase family protein [Chloroflexota bacterium]
MMPSLQERLAGAVWGHLVGDAVGVPYEFRSAGQIGEVEFRGGGSHGVPAGTWSDDGALMLALLDSLQRETAPGEERFDTTDQARRFVAWMDEGAYTPDGEGKFDIGITTVTALRAFRDGASAEEAGGTRERNNGNGSLMRILPIALVERDLDDGALVEHAHRSSVITHGHAIAQVCCALYVLVARNLVDGQSRDEALPAASERLRELYVERPDAAARLKVLDLVEGYGDRTGSGYVVDAFWSAWDALAGSSSYAETITRAVKYGNDTDTTACIAGGLAGITYGYAGIPPEWLDGMRGADVVRPAVARLEAGTGQP